MSIPRLDVPTAVLEEPPETALIAQIANEFFSEFRRAAQNGELNPSGAGSSSNGLAGSYPSDSRSFAPPVHPATPVTPVSAPSSPVTSATLPGSLSQGSHASGGHCPDSSESYPFGEPRNVLIPSGTPGSTESKPPAGECLSGGDIFSSPGYYFLRQTESVSYAPAAGLAPAAVPSPTRFDVDAIRKDFPALHQTRNNKPVIWLDNAATTHKPQSVIDATSQFYAHDNSNIHRAAHTQAARATELFEGGREKVRRFIGAGDAKEIVFVRGTTEAINLVAQTFGRKNIGAGDEIILTTMEHHANIVPWQILAEQSGAIIRVAPINDRGELVLEQFASLLSSRTKLVAVTQVANALGTINPVEQIIALAHSWGVPVLVDGAQSAPHMPINVQAMDADFFALSGHKIFGPTGIGVLYGKAKLLEEMPPWHGGGNMIQDVTFTRTVYQGIPAKFEAGTADIAGVVGLSAAVDYLSALGLSAIAAYEHELLDYATAALQTIPGLRMIGTAAAKASVLSFVIDGVASESVAKHLDGNGIAVRSGHHCAQPAVRRYGVESTVRPSLAFYNTRSEIDALRRALEQLPRSNT